MRKTKSETKIAVYFKKQLHAAVLFASRAAETGCKRLSLSCGFAAPIYRRGLYSGLGCRRLHRRFRDAERIGAYCRSCPNYGRSWGCPPFGFSVEEYLAGYDSVLLVATKITPRIRNLPIAEAAAMIRPERIRLESRLLGMERLYGGRSFAYVGSCLYCPEGACTRPDGKPCRHPEWVRPSLEACGFDIGRTTSELFGLELKWGVGGRMPEYLILVCGFFHHAGNVIWNG